MLLPEQTVESSMQNAAATKPIYFGVNDQPAADLPLQFVDDDSQISRLHHTKMVKIILLSNSEGAGGMAGIATAIPIFGD